MALAVEAWHVFQVVGGGVLTLAAAGWLLRLEFVSRPFLILFGVINLVLLLGEKLALRLSARHVRSRGLNFRTLLLVGINPRSEEVARIIEDHPHWGLKLLGFVAPNGSFPETVNGLPVLGRAEDLPGILQRLVVDEVIFVLSRRQLDEFEESFLLCSELGIRARVALYFPHMKARVILEELEGIPLLTFTNTPGAIFPLFVKWLADVVGSVILLALLSPLLLLIGLVVWLSSKGPMLYVQRRCGLNGRRFTLYKFRTMYVGADQRLDEVAHLNEVNGPAFKARHDPRVTPIGRWLRRWSLDELPQLVNVLKGEMSLVGTSSADPRRGRALRALAAPAAVHETGNHRSLAGLRPRRDRRLRRLDRPRSALYRPVVAVARFQDHAQDHPGRHLRPRRSVVHRFGVHARRVRIVSDSPLRSRSTEDVASHSHRQ